MEDIEDVIRIPTAINLERNHVIVRKRVKGDGEIFYGDSFVPGTQKIYIRTWGCTHNTSDSEQMAGLLSAAGHQLTNKREDASLWILNSCTVKTPSETQLENMVREAQKLNKFVVVAGCVSQVIF
ncbi:unnamed protein product [Onchocerca flexuosa]|uniref:MTTase N-terminal domain-containing protein n=1 Tax=Onchocerca flexuosa TaxID=387005 RepID=A0A183HMU1_9BILA|nr:unnamed protein product [Onchocerca flexuosa]